MLSAKKKVKQCFVLFTKNCKYKYNYWITEWVILPLLSSVLEEETYAGIQLLLLSLLWEVHRTNCLQLRATKRLFSSFLLNKGDLKDSPY